MSIPTVLLMLKAPVEGEVKTRLGRDIGAGAALQAYRRLVEYQVRQIPKGWHVQICYSPPEAGAPMQEWLGEAYAYSAQASGDLGTRLAQATEEHFCSTTAPLIILGGDCPYLDGARLLRAAALLIESDAVLVPAVDGGYCLIGFRAAKRHLFYAISWSTGTVLAETRERLRECGLTWAEMVELEDVDDEGSWRRALDSNLGL